MRAKHFGFFPNYKSLIFISNGHHIKLKPHKHRGFEQETDLWWFAHFFLPSMQPQCKHPDTAQADYKWGRWFTLQGSHVFAFPCHVKVEKCNAAHMHAHIQCILRHTNTLSYTLNYTKVSGVDKYNVLEGSLYQKLMWNAFSKDCQCGFFLSG